MINGFAPRRLAPSGDEHRMQAMQGLVEELWDALSDAETCHDGLVDIVRDIEAELEAMSTV
jgi:hypothetical protein